MFKQQVGITYLILSYLNVQTTSTLTISLELIPQFNVQLLELASCN